VDEHGQNSSAGERANGTDAAGAARWTNGAVAGHTWSRATTPGEPVTDPAGPAHDSAARRPLADDDTAQWHAPGLSDETPAGGLPVAEPPLWREAARYAANTPSPAVSSAPPRPSAHAAYARVAPDAPTAPSTHAASASASAPVVPSGAPVSPSRWDPDALHRDNGVYGVPEAADRSTLAEPSPEAYQVADPPPAMDPPPVVAPRSVPPAPAEPRATLADLPQRVPAEPDVPGSGEPWRAIPPAEAPQLARIADQLRRDDVPSESRGDGFDVDEVLDAVRGVEGVRAASLRASATGAHTLRLDLADDADPVQVSSVVARLLQERMGLSAAPQDIPQQRGPQESLRGSQPAPAWPAEPAQPEDEPEPRSRPLSAPPTGPRVVIDQVQVNVVGLNATVEVRLVAGPHRALGLASGPAIDSYVVRLAAVSAARAVDELMREVGRTVVSDDSSSRCFVEHTGVVPFGSTEVAVVVVLLVCGGWVEQLAGSAVVDGDARHAAVRATLGAVNRRLDALLA
jgi:hypothetical protein